MDDSIDIDDVESGHGVIHDDCGFVRLVRVDPPVLAVVVVPSAIVVEKVLLLLIDEELVLSLHEAVEAVVLRGLALVSGSGEEEKCDKAKQ